MPHRLKGSHMDVRQRILDAARQEFSAKGYHLAVVDDIAAQAGVSKGAIYWHFENKSALLLAVARTEMGRLVKYLEAVSMEEGHPPVARIEAFIVATLTYYTDHPEFCNLLKIFTLPGGPELDEATLETLIVDEYRRGRQIIETLLQKAVEQGEVEASKVSLATSMLVALLEGLVYQWVVDREAIPIRERANDIARIFLEGVIKRPC